MTTETITDVAIELRDVSKTHGTGPSATVAVRDVSLVVPRGQFVAIVGHSGAGKTTLLGIMGGLERPDRGAVVIDGIAVDGLRDGALAALRLRRVGFVFQDFNLLPLYTAAENVGWPLAYAGAPRAAIRARTDAVLADVGLAGRGDRLPAELSGGEQQRVAIARAIVAAPAVVLADEPTGNLDSATGRRVLDLLRRLNIEQDTTIAMVTHDLGVASCADRIVELADGWIVRDTAAARGRRPAAAAAEERVQ